MKFPVFRAFAASLAYLVTHFLTILKILWLPVLGLMAAQFYATPALLSVQLDMNTMQEAGGDPYEVFSSFEKMARPMGILYGAMFLFYPMMTAGVLRHVVRGESPRLPFYLSFGMDELRVFAAYLLFMVMIFISAFAGMLAYLVLTMVFALVSEGIGALVAIIGVFALMGAFIWFITRMSIIFPAAVGERSVGIADSWRLTDGNFWGLLVYWIFWGVVMMFGSMLFFLVAAAGYFSIFAELFTTAIQNPDNTAEVERRMIEMQSEMMDPTKPGFWPFAIGSYVFMILYTAIWTSAGGVAYRYLTGTERG